MGTKKDARRKKLLGMSYYQARRKLIYKLIREYFKLLYDMRCGICGDEIKPDEQFHIDHTDGWVCIETYMDIRKIKPAHPQCNTEHGGLAKHYPESVIKKKIRQKREKGST